MNIPKLVGLASYALVFQLLAACGGGSGAGNSTQGSSSALQTNNRTFAISGSVSGLASGTQLTILNNGADSKIVSANGGFTFASPVIFNSSYAVTVGVQPTGQTCTVLNGSGANVAGAVSNISILCTANPVSNGGAVTACREITSSGVFTLSADVTAPANYTSGNSPACISIHDTSNVTLDCNNKKLTGSPALAINSVRNFKVSNCTIQNISAINLDIKNSDTGTFSANTYFGDGLINYVNVVSTNNLLFDSNTVTGHYEQNLSHNNIISNNQFTAIPGVFTGVVINSNTGVNNQILGNKIDGSWDLVARIPFNSNIGADDGIGADNEIGLVIKNNIIKNVWECGIEFSSTIASSEISGNQISYAGLCGIGGWYYLSIVGTTFSQNTINESGNLFTFYRSGGLIAAPTTALQQIGGDTSVIFKDNIFSGNTFTTTGIIPAPLSGESAFIQLYNYLDYPFQYPPRNPGETAPLPSQFIISNNTFTNNNFGHVHLAPQLGAINFTVPGVVIDGGGNVCTIPSYDVNYPLACN